MADEAFALSPISARAALPGEEDYCRASAKPSWNFAGALVPHRSMQAQPQYSDTRMVLTRWPGFEQSLTTQK